MDDFASTALFNLIAFALQKQGHDVSVNTQFEGKTTSLAKRNILALALSKLGPSGVLRIGQGIRDYPFHPILAVLRKARNPHDLLQRWQRLEGYYHGHHRVKQLESKKNSATLQHYSTSSEPPTCGEDLVIAGFLAALLQEIGVEGLAMSIERTRVIDNGRVVETPLKIGDTSHWHIKWSDCPLNADVPDALTKDTNDEEVVRRVKALINEDPARGWSLTEMAAELLTSKRTLQRRLSAAGSSFQLLLREVRVECAADGLLGATASLGEIGYACGFSDQAHFSREFKKRYNIAPSEYIQLAHDEVDKGSG